MGVVVLRGGKNTLALNIDENGNVLRMTGDEVMREQAIRFVMGVLRHASDWQEGQHALADHPRFGPWLEASGYDALAEAQSIIREAEERLGDALPY
jgi:hypothetical protein